MHTSSRLTVLFAALMAGSFAIPAAGADVKIPQVQDARLELTLIASEPAIVTPIGVAVDDRGRLFVVESHTHFPKTNYSGPKSDRVKLFVDSNQDGLPDRSSVFAEGFHHAMNAAFSPDGALHVVHRNGVIRLEDKDGDGVAESRRAIVEMETPGNYPHNGLGGVVFSADGWLYVGQGENLGERYTIKGSDGSSHNGHGEGGNVFRCRPDGSKLELFATGFWNPFGLAVYGGEFLLALDNDPDSRPPNRLLDVVKHGDYGFKFRLGRSGLHPFQAWNGELPGTLPMVAGTGEAACSLLAGDRTGFPREFRETVLVSAAWDHQIEVYRPKPFGASLRADREILVQGDANFRPVGLAAAPDGSVYFTDWVDVSYNVHGLGRIWRLAAKPDLAVKVGAPFALVPNKERAQMRRLQKVESSEQAGAELTAALSDNDPFILNAAVDGLSQAGFRRRAEEGLSNPSPKVRLGALLALRRAGGTNAADSVGQVMGDPDAQVRLMAVVWAGEARMTQLSNRLSAVLSAGPVTPALLRAHASTAKILSGMRKPVSEGTGGKVVFFDASESSGVSPAMGDTGQDLPVQSRLDWIRRSAQSTNTGVVRELKRIARSDREPVDVRCEAVLALAASAEAKFFLELLEDSKPAVRIEAARALRTHRKEADVEAVSTRKIQVLGERDPDLVEQLNFVLSPVPRENELQRPSHGRRPSTEEDWRSALKEPGDPGAGWRVFFHPAVGCAKCHRIEDYGGQLGPDLSTIARGANREKLIQSILNPSRDIAPQFVSHTIETKDDQTFTGLLIGDSAEAGVTLFMANGRAALIPPSLVASHNQSKVSLMPDDLEQALTVQDFRDLLAFLLTRR